MNELQLKLCDIQGRLFVLSGKHRYNGKDFVKTFMTSNTAKELDSKYNRMQWAGEEYLIEEISDYAKKPLEVGGDIFSEDVLYWIGYTYRYWQM